MNLLLKLLLIPGLLCIACLIAGVDGMLHNQISYTVSPEYFTEFKFSQFRIPDAVPRRFGVAMVGWKASWWMGIVIGIFLVPIGLVLRTPRAYFIGTLRALLAVVVTALIVGGLGLVVAFAAVGDHAPGSLRNLPSVTNPAAFLRAGTMHNCSYIGGFLGLFSGIVVLGRRRVKEADEKPGASRPAE